MKNRLIFLLSASLGLSLQALGVAPDYVPMRVIQTSEVSYPYGATQLALTTGEARVTLQVDESGKLTDSLVTAYSHRLFADSALSAVKRWSYEPAYLHGQARSATVDLTFTFETRGMVVVDMTVSSYAEMRSVRIRPGAYSFAACQLRDLDRIPTPAKVVRPLYPAEAAKNKEAGHVTVTFFIDENGKVRMPAVSREAAEPFAAAAIEAVSQWEFEPPLSKGHAVLVQVQQVFAFKPAP